MSGPRRLVDGAAASPELLRLLRAARPPRPLDAATFERSRRHIVALGSVPAALGVLVWIQHAALGAALGLVAAAAVSAPRLFTKADVAAPAASVVVSRREAAVGTVAPPRVESVVLPEPIRAPVAVTAPVASAGGLSRELALLESARSDAERRPGSALALLAQHEREFQRGALVLEREFLVVSVLIRLGRRGEAEARAAALRLRSPGSLYDQRLDALFRDAGGAR